MIVTSTAGTALLNRRKLTNYPITVTPVFRVFKRRYNLRRFLVILVETLFKIGWKNMGAGIGLLIFRQEQNIFSYAAHSNRPLMFIRVMLETNSLAVKWQKQTRLQRQGLRPSVCPMYVDVS